MTSELPLWEDTTPEEEVPMAEGATTEVVEVIIEPTPMMIITRTSPRQRQGQKITHVTKGQLKRQVNKIEII